MWDFLTQLTTFISLLAEQGWLVPLALIMLSATYMTYILIKYFQKRIELKIKEKEKEWKLNQYDIDLENHFMFSEYLLSINKVDTLELKWWKQKNKICRDFLKSYIYIIEEHYKKLIEELRAEFWDDIEKDLIDNAEAVDKLVASGAFTRNEVRELFGKERSDNPELDEFVITKNYQSAGAAEGGENEWRRSTLKAWLFLMIIKRYTIGMA